MSGWTKENRLLFVKKMMLAVLHILLFVPILTLFAELNNIPFTEPLIVFFIATQFILILLPKWWLWIPAQLAVFAYAFYRSFPYLESFGREWLRLTLLLLRNQVMSVWNGESPTLPIGLSLVLFMLLSTIASILLLKFRRPWISFLVCFIYLLVLDVFTETQVIEYLVPVLVFGVSLVSVSYVSTKKSPLSFFLSLGTLVLVSAGLSQLAAWTVRRFPQHQEAMQTQATEYQLELEARGFYDWIEAFSRGQAFRQTGFGEDDRHLGGPIQQDFTPVFNAYTETPHYWRITTKDFYTGTGWEEEMAPFPLPVNLPFRDFPRDIATSNPAEEADSIQIDFTSEEFAYVPYTYGTDSLAYTDESSQTIAGFEFPSEKFLVTEDPYGKMESPEAYELRVHEFSVDADFLRQTELSADTLDRAALYLQIPEALPQRVRDLALEITQEAANQYDQVKGIENFLKNHESFRYSMQDAAYLPEGWDYVDHFLFESQTGYCDYFSTSMVLLVRSLGFPARWAKGFNSGELVIDDNGSTFRQVTNANAHSWPEVYFEGYGWVPFEPTPSFSQPVTETQAMAEEEPSEPIFPVTEEAIPEVATPTEPTEDVLEVEDLERTEEGNNATRQTASPQQETSRQAIPQPSFSLWASVLGIVILLIVLILVIFRNRLAVGLLRKAIETERITFPQASRQIDRLFSQLKKKEASQTVRQYYRQWAAFVPDQSAAIQTFIQMEEELLYGSKKPAEKMSPEQQSIALKMLEVYERIASQKRTPAETAK